MIDETGSHYITMIFNVLRKHLAAFWLSLNTLFCIFEQMTVKYIHINNCQHKMAPVSPTGKDVVCSFTGFFPFSSGLYYFSNFKDFGSIALA